MILKKEKGALDDILPIVVFIFLMTVMMFIYLGFSQVTNERSTLDTVAREYILKMETDGYLTNGAGAGGDNDKAELIAALNDLGFYGDDAGGAVTATNLNGTTLTEQNYGDTITLSISVYAKDRSLDADSFNLFTSIVHDKYRNIKVTVASTSKV